MTWSAIVVFFVHPSKPLHDIGTWFSGHAVGIALWGKNKTLSLVETKAGKTGNTGLEQWVYLYVVKAKYETCWTGPGYMAMLTMGGTFAGWINLFACDATTGVMMAGPCGRMSTALTRGEHCFFL